MPVEFGTLGVELIAVFQCKLCFLDRVSNTGIAIRLELLPYVPINITKCVQPVDFNVVDELEDALRMAIKPVSLLNKVKLFYPFLRRSIDCAAIFCHGLVIELFIHKSSDRGVGGYTLFGALEIRRELRIEISGISRAARNDFADQREPVGLEKLDDIGAAKHKLFGRRHHFFADTFCSGFRFAFRFKPVERVLHCDDDPPLFVFAWFYIDAVEHTGLKFSVEWSLRGED